MEKMDATAEEKGTEMDEMGKSRLFVKKKILYNNRFSQVVIDLQNFWLNALIPL
jgi:hypothetical protein